MRLEDAFITTPEGSAIQLETNGFSCVEPSPELDRRLRHRLARFTAALRPEQGEYEVRDRWDHEPLLPIYDYTTWKHGEFYGAQNRQAKRFAWYSAPIRRLMNAYTFQVAERLFARGTINPDFVKSFDFSKLLKDSERKSGYTEEDNWQRVRLYRSIDEHRNIRRMHVHTDRGGLTMLGAADKSLCIVRFRNGSEGPVASVEAPIGPFTLTAGDAVEAISEGRVKATPHMVWLIDPTIPRAAVLVRPVSFDDWLRIAGRHSSLVEPKGRYLEELAR